MTRQLPKDAPASFRSGVTSNNIRLQCSLASSSSCQTAAMSRSAHCIAVLVLATAMLAAVHGAAPGQVTVTPLGSPSPPRAASKATGLHDTWKLRMGSTEAASDLSAAWLDSHGGAATARF